MESEITPPSPTEWITKVGIKLYRFKAQLKRWWWVVLLTVSIGLAIESWMVWRKPVEWESTGSLVHGGKLNVANGARYEEERTEFYGTQLKMLQSAEVQDRTTRRLAI